MKNNTSPKSSSKSENKGMKQGGETSKQKPMKLQDRDSPTGCNDDQDESGNSTPPTMQ